MDMNSLVNEIKSDYYLNAFFELLWTNVNVSEMFFLHKNDLFPTEYNTCIDVLAYQSDNEVLDISVSSMNRIQYNEIKKMIKFLKYQHLNHYYTAIIFQLF